MAEKIDLWVLAATAEVGDSIEATLREIFEKDGISLLSLDWSPRPLPRLAVLLAAANVETIRWFATNAASTDAGVLKTALHAIVADPKFPGQLAQLQKDLNAAEVGLGSLRGNSTNWLNERLTTRHLSNQSFGQHILVADIAAPAIYRTDLVNDLNGLIALESEPAVVAVLGEEGVGKTWLVAQWWATLPDPPITIMASGRRVDHLNPGQPLESLARLIADQTGRVNPENVEAWIRRLERWKQGGAALRSLHFVVVLDGLDEHPGCPWADIIKGLTAILLELGGVLVVTCRPAHWDGEIAPRIRASVKSKRMLITGYSDPELVVKLLEVGVSPSALSAPVREFIRNPRVCSVALGLLGRLTPDELTIERLLLEYWNARVVERGDLVSHNTEDFHKLIRSHASAWLASPQKTFDRDEWQSHSGVAKRLGSARPIHGDLTEIAEGRFLTVSPTDSSRYEFRFEALPFALGLLIAAEIQMIHETKGNIHDEDLERIVGPIRGFDLLSQIIAAAAGLTCLNPKFSPTGSMVLIRMFFGLQNLDQGAFDSLAAYVPTSPDIFLDVAESPNGDAIRADEFILVLRRASHHGTVQDALKLRLPHWLGRWSRGTGVKFRDPAQDLQRKVDRDGRITQIIAGLSVDERHIFQNLTTEADSVMALNLDYVAALTIAGSALHPYAKGFIGWALAQRIAGDVHNASDDLAWVIRLNKVDWAATSKAMASEANSLSQHSAESFKRAAAIAWRLTGDAGQAKLAAQLFPHQIQIGWKRSDLFCDTNAFDPDAARCTNIVNAVSKIGALDSGEAWNFMSPTAEDHDLEMATAPLARFEPMVIVNKLREIFHTAPQRVGLKLRQLAWRLPGFSPLFDAQTLEAIQASYLAVVADPSRVEVADAKWITGFLAMSLLPHLAPEPQLDLILSLPPECLLLVAMESLIKPLSKTQLEVALQAAVISKDETRLTRTLFFPSSVRHIFTERTAELISDLVWHENETVAICALNAASLAGDVALFSRLLFDAKPDNGKVNSYLSLTRGKALAAATIATGDMSKLHCIPSRFIGFVAVQTKGIALTQFSNQFDQLFKHLLTPTTVQPPVTFEIKVEASEDGSRTRRRIDEVGGRSLNRIQDLLNTNFKVETERHEALLTDFAEYERRLTVEGAADLADDPIRVGQCEILKLDKTRFEGWIDKILSTQDKLALRQIRNLALTLAHTFSTENSEKSAAILCLMKNVQPIVQIEVGHRRLPLYDRCLFSTATGLGLDQLRRELFECATEDAAIADATAAAEASGATMWLDAYVSELLTFPDPWKCALGMTIDGFRAKSIELPEIELVEGGFLTAVATSAGINRTNAKWASHWLELAIESTSGTDFWRYGQLALGVADGRAVDMFANTDDGQWTHYSNEFLSELKKTSKKVTEERRKTLYGVKAPSQALALFLRDN